MKKKKKLVLLSLMTLFLFQGAVKVALADTLEYPFESIQIVEAKTFQVTVPATIQSDSILFPNVDVDEILDIYFGGLSLIQGGTSQPTEMIVVADSQGVDLVRYVINSYLRDETMERWSFGWQIMIDPTIGIYKDLELADNIRELDIINYFAGNVWEFRDDKDMIYPTVADTFQAETGLAIEIAAYVPEGEVVSEMSPSARMYQIMSFFANFGLTACTNQSSSVSQEVSSINSSSLEDMQPLGHETLIEQLSIQLKAVFE